MYSPLFSSEGANRGTTQSKKTVPGGAVRCFSQDLILGLICYVVCSHGLLLRSYTVGQSSYRSSGTLTQFICFRVPQRNGAMYSPLCSSGGANCGSTIKKNLSPSGTARCSSQGSFSLLTWMNFMVKYKESAAKQESKILDLSYLGENSYDKCT